MKKELEELLKKDVTKLTEEELRDLADQLRLLADEKKGKSILKQKKLEKEFIKTLKVGDCFITDLKKYNGYYDTSQIPEFQIFKVTEILEESSQVKVCSIDINYSDLEVSRYDDYRTIKDTMATKSSLSVESFDKICNFLDQLDEEVEILYENYLSDIKKEIK